MAAAAFCAPPSVVRESRRPMGTSDAVVVGAGVVGAGVVGAAVAHVPVGQEL